MRLTGCWTHSTSTWIRLPGTPCASARVDPARYRLTEERALRGMFGRVRLALRAGRLASLASGPSVMLEARCDTTRSVSQVLVPFSDLQTLIGGRLARWRS